MEKDGEPFFEVEMNEKPIYFSPKDVLKIIFNKLLGNFDFFDNKPHFNPSSLKQKANNISLGFERKICTKLN